MSLCIIVVHAHTRTIIDYLTYATGIGIRPLAVVTMYVTHSLFVITIFMTHWWYYVINCLCCG